MYPGRLRRLAPFIDDPKDVWVAPLAFLRRLLVQAVDVTGVGCLNEVQRVLSGVVDEGVVNTAGVEEEGAAAGTAASALQAAAHKHLALATKRHLAQCVVGLAHRPCATAQLLRHYFPWAQRGAAGAMAANDGSVHEVAEPMAGACDAEAKLAATVHAPLMYSREVKLSGDMEPVRVNASPSAGPRVAVAMAMLQQEEHRDHLRLLQELTAAEADVVETGVAVHRRQMQIVDQASGGRTSSSTK